MDWMLYGANGYTGQLIASEATSRGMRPVLAGRNAEKIEALARELDCPSRAFALSSAAEVGRHLDGISAVLHCAGPFSETAAPMMEACIARGVHYLDITGEIDVIELASRQHEQAEAAGVTLMPSVGMDVVPSDCLAAMLADAVPDATRLELAFAADWSLSPGTAKTVWQHAGVGGRIRKDGNIVAVPTAWKIMEIPFRRGPRWGMTIPWGDVSSAYHTTGIPNIEVYTALPQQQLNLARRFRRLASLARFSLIQSTGRWWINRRIKGPDEYERAAGRTEFWVRATDDKGQTAEAALETPNGYLLTVETALAILQKVLDGQVRTGFLTPAKALGADFIQERPDVTFHWIRRPEDGSKSWGTKS